MDNNDCVRARCVVCTSCTTISPPAKLPYILVHLAKSPINNGPFKGMPYKVGLPKPPLHLKPAHSWELPRQKWGFWRHVHNWVTCWSLQYWSFSLVLSMVVFIMDVYFYPPRGIEQFDKSYTHHFLTWWKQSSKNVTNKIKITNSSTTCSLCQIKSADTQKSCWTQQKYAYQNYNVKTDIGPVS